MMARDIIRRRCFGKNGMIETKHDVIVTSTPMKLKELHQLEMECSNTVIKSLEKSPSPTILQNKNTRKTVRFSSNNRSECLQRCSNEGTESIDKISLIINPEFNDGQEVVPSNASNSENKRKKAKRFIVRHSNKEENSWQNKNKGKKVGKNNTVESNPLTASEVLTRIIQTRKAVKTNEPLPCSKKIITRHSSNQGIILPKKNMANSSKAIFSIEKCTKKAPLLSMQKSSRKRMKDNLNISENLLKDDDSEDSDEQISTMRMKRAVEIMDKNNQQALRRSNRKRSKPLEYWNGERMDVIRDFWTGIQRPTIKKRKKNAKEVKDTEVEPERQEIEQSHQNSSNIPNPKNKHKSEACFSGKSETKTKRKSILKSRSNAKSCVNIEYAVIESGIPIDNSRLERNLQSDCIINFTDIQSSKKALPDSDYCIVLPGLDTAGGNISSAIVKMQPKCITRSQAPDLYHLVFCVMVGTVSVIFNETSLEVKTYGHLAIPCGVSYKMINIGSDTAILSCFKVACTDAYKRNSL